MPYLLAPGSQAAATAGGVTLAQVNAAIAASGHMEDRGQFADLATANASTVWPVPAGGAWHATLADGTSLIARGSAAAWTVTEPAGATATVVNKGVHATVAAADAAEAANFPVPAGELWLAYTPGGEALYAPAGATGFALEVGGTGNVVDQGNGFASLVDANTAAGLPGTPVPAGETWQARLADGTALYANAGDTTFTAEPSPPVLDKGDGFADVAAADAANGLPGTPVPAGELWVAQLADGRTAQARPGDTTFTVAPTPTAAPDLQVAEGNNVTVVDNDTLVAAEKNTDVTIQAGVTRFWLVEDTDNPWTETPLTTPNVVVPAGDTLDPGIVIATAADGGGPILLWRDGTVWKAAQNAGGAGGGTDVDAYTHTQAVATTVWNISHNLGFNPSGVIVQDGTGADIEYDDITFVDVNNLTLSFLVPQAGTAHVS